MNRVQTGIETLLQDEDAMRALRGARVGLLVNPTSVTHDLDHIIDVLRARGAQVVRLFGPEHGVRAEAQDMEAVDAQVDALTGLPVVSLYGHDFASLEPSLEQVSDLDIVVADIQDIGSRYYTYSYTIGLMMKVCGQTDTEVWVLDRPNPLGGEVLEGNVVAPECVSFVGMQPMATRYAMTLGELVGFYARYGGWSAAVRVFEMKGWARSMWFEDTGVPWVQPSPNMPTVDTAVVYPGQCLLEGTNLSEGRGTTRPFEVFGAPWVDAQALRAKLQAYALPGVAWRALSFKPMFQKHSGQICQGIGMHVTDRESFRSLTVSLCIISACLELFESFDWRAEAYEFVEEVPAIDLLLGQRWVRDALTSGDDPRGIAERMAGERVEFEAQRASCLLY